MEFYVWQRFSIFFFGKMLIVGGKKLKNKFINMAFSTIQKEKEITPLEEKKLRYGLEAFYNMFTKAIVLSILAIILHIIPQFFLLLFVYSTLRLYAFGIHAKKSWQCWILTIPVYIGGCLFCKYGTVNTTVFLSIWFVGFISFLLFAPSDTPARPLIHKEKRIRAKILSIFILFVYLFLIFYIDKPIFTNCVSVGILMEVLAINPITYKLFQTQFNNYKVYQRKTV